MIETKTSTCERGDDLISFLYGEANEREATQFEEHLQVCLHCRNEMSSFGQIRESIGTWKETALNAFVTPQFIAPVRQKSALAALKSFFDLSPLWMKGAIGFACRPVLSVAGVDAHKIRAAIASATCDQRTYFYPATTG